MKRIIFVLLASLAASSMSVAPVKAQSLTITTDNGGSYERADYRDRRWHRHGKHRGWERRHMRHANCRTKRVETHRNGRVVIKETRVCR